MVGSDGFTTVNRKRQNNRNEQTKRYNRVEARQDNRNDRQDNRNDRQDNRNDRQDNMSRVVVKSTQTRRKSSRTLLLKGIADSTFNYEGLENVDKSPQGNVFLVFNTLENARRAFKDLRINKVNCKYSYYKLFFKSTGMDMTKDYDELKGLFLSFLNQQVPNLNVLYFKYYKRDGNFTGSGDFVVDRKVDCDLLVNNRTIKMSDNNDVSFYRFRLNRGRNSGNSSEDEVTNE